jgi:ribosomal protein L24
MSAKLKIKKGDKVVVTTGKDKGKQGEVVRTIPSENRAVVRGVNLAKRHQKQTAARKAASSRRNCRSMCRTWLCATQGRQADPRGLQDSG